MVPFGSHLWRPVISEIFALISQTISFHDTSSLSSFFLYSLGILTMAYWLQGRRNFFTSSSSKFFENKVGFIPV